MVDRTFLRNDCRIRFGPMREVNKEFKDTITWSFQDVDRKVLLFVGEAILLNVTDTKLESELKAKKTK